MLRLQANPNCNLNCSYCYIPSRLRRRTGTMSDEVLETTLKRLVDEDLLGDELAISWHGAEPLTAGVTWYRDAFQRIERALSGRTRVSHIFQTNGVLISETWCRFWAEHNTYIGVSLDGSEQQSAARVNWAGRPVYDQVMRGIDVLNREGVSWTLLTVVSRESMSDPEAFIRFVRSSGCSHLGFKVEETNVDHTSELSGVRDVERTYAEFARALWDAFPEGSIPTVREFEEYRMARRAGGQVVPVTLIPFRNLTVAVNGDFTIFAGELLFGEDDRFSFGNVLDGPLLDCLVQDKFRDIGREIMKGVNRCATVCAHYRDCGSFYISQKYAETGGFDADETLACRLEIKTLHNTLDNITDRPRRSLV